MSVSNTFLESPSSIEVHANPLRKVGLDILAPQLHQAIRDGEFERLPILLTDCEAIDALDEVLKDHGGPSAIATSTGAALWHETATGWTAVHFAASHCLPLGWLEWILIRARDNRSDSYVSPEYSKDRLSSMSKSLLQSPFLTRQTALGHSVLDVFLASSWDPLPWQMTAAVRTAALNLQQAVSVVCNHRILIKALQESLAAEEVLFTWRLEKSSYPHEYTFRETSLRRRQIRLRHPLLSVALQRVQRFLCRLILLCRAALSTVCPEERSVPYRQATCVLAANGSCPRMIIKLLLLLEETASGDVTLHAASRLETPLHTWALSQTHHFQPSRSCSRTPYEEELLETLIEAFSDTLAIGDRCPLHLAVQTGAKPWSLLKRLVDAAPGMLEKEAICTLPNAGAGERWPLVAIAAVAGAGGTDLSHRWCSTRKQRIAAGRKGWLLANFTGNLLVQQANPSRKPLAEQNHTKEYLEARKEWECEHLLVVFKLLQMYPQALPVSNAII